MFHTAPYVRRYAWVCASLLAVSAATAADPADADRYAAQHHSWQEPGLPIRPTPSAGRSSSVYARRTEPAASESNVSESPTAATPEDRSVVDGISPILAADLEYSPPPPLPDESTYEQVAPTAVDPVVDPHVQPAVHLAPAEPPASLPDSQADRRLLTSSTRSKRERQPGGNGNYRSRLPQLPTLPRGTITTTIGATSIVAGLFFLTVYLLRRGMPRSSAVLPDDVVCVLGRKQLAGRQFAQLLRVGNKLVLVSVTPDGTEPLAEVTDPCEVDRLLGLCQQTRDNSTTADFQDVLERLSREHAPLGFLGAEASATAGGHAAGSYLDQGGHRA